MSKGPNQNIYLKSSWKFVRVFLLSLCFAFTSSAAIASGLQSEACKATLAGRPLISDDKIELLRPDLLIKEQKLTELAEFIKDLKSLGHVLDQQENLKMKIQLALARHLNHYGKRVEKFASGSLGHIRKISALEAALLNYHLKQVAGCGYVEFEAFLFEDSNKEQTILYHTSYLGATVDVDPAMDTAFNELRRKGHQLKIHIHNHPFIPPEVGGGGQVVPSGSPEFGDIKTYLRLKKEHGLERAIITNGIDSVEISAKEFDSL